MINLNADYSPHVQRKREARIDEILGIALQIQAQNPAAGFTLHQIAEELGCATPAIYRYFRSKDAIVTELHIRVIQELAGRIASLATACTAHFAHLASAQRASICLAAMAWCYFDFAATEPTRFALLTASLVQPRQLELPEENEQIYAAVMQAFQPMVACIAEIQGTTTPLDADTLQRSISFWSTVQGVVQLQRLHTMYPGMLDLAAILHRTIATTLQNENVTAAQAEEYTTQARAFCTAETCTRTQ